tara:strand:- start:1242 stop:7142 length:5901 start_codon:yes stop_codon:yes gene_type:complete
MAGSGYTFTTATCATTASFAAIQISGQSSVLADSTLDTLTFTSVGPLLLTTNASTDTVSFSAAPHVAKIHTGTSGYLPYYTAGTEVSKSTGLYWDSSNSKMGVQTTAPSAHLTVSGHISARGDVICETLYVADQSIRFKNGARFLTTSAGNIVLMPSPDNGNQGTAIVITSGGQLVATPVSAVNNFIAVATGSLQDGDATFTGFVSSNVVFSSGGNSGQWEVGYIDSQLNKTDITWIAASSATWDNTYSTVKANSGAWSAGGTYAFKTVTLSGKNIAAAIGPDIAAESTTDTLTLCAGPNIALISDSATDTITISSVGGDGGGGGGGGGISFDGSTANGMLTYKDSDEATVEANYTFDGSEAILKGTLSARDALTTRLLNVSGDTRIVGDLTILGDDIVMGTNTVGHILMGGGTNFGPVAQTSITSVGTVSAGTWQGTEVGLGYGGTELVGETDGKIVIADGSGAPVHLDVGSSTGITILGTIATGTWQGTAVADAYVAGSSLWNWVASNSATKYEDTSVHGTLSARDRIIASTGASLSGNVTIGGDLEVLGDDLKMGTNTVGHVLMGDGTNFGPVAQTSITSVGTVSAGTWQGTAVADAYVAGSALWNWVASNSATKYEDTTVHGTLSARDRIIASVGASLSGNVTIGGDMTSDKVYVKDTAGVYADKIRRYSDSSTTTKILLNDEILKFYTGHSSDNVVTIKDREMQVHAPLSAGGIFTAGGNGTVGANISGDLVVGDDLIVKGNNLTINGVAYTMPSDDGDAGEQLQTDGSGTLSWESAGSGGGGMTAFILEDGDGTEVSISNAEEVKFVEGGGIDINWTDETPGSDGDPFDLTFTVNAAQTGITSLLATDIKIGEDDETKVDFETANEIHLYADNANRATINSSGASIVGTLSAKDRLIASTGASLSGNVTIGGDLEVLGDDIVMGTNTVGHILMGGGTNFGPVAQTSITSVGTISAGTWQGTEVGLGYGGTELVGETDGKIVIADGSGAPVHLDVGSSTGITILGTIATGVWQGTAVADAYVAGSALWNWVASNSATKYEDTTVHGTLSARDRIIASVGASLSGNVTIGGDLEVLGDDLKMGTNTDAYLLVADGTNFNPVAMSGDATITNAGVLSIAANSIDGTHIALGSDASGDIMYYNGTNYVRLAKGSDDEVLTLDSGLPSWAAASGGGSGDITDVVAGAGLTGGATSGSATLNVSGGALIDVTGNEVDVDLTEATEAAIANGDYIIFLDGGATGTHAKEAVADLATLFAGAGITATNSVIAVDAAQTGITSLLAADIKIGEDDQTKIDFETADEIHFYANNVHQVKLIDNAFTPAADSDVDLGTSSLYWKDAYIDTVRTTGNIVAAGTVSASDPGGSAYGSSPHWTYVADNSGTNVPMTFVNRVGSGTATADTDGASASYNAAKAFDGNDGTFFEPANDAAQFPNWLKYDFGSGNAYTITAVTFRIDGGHDNYVDRAPKDWFVQGSNNDSDWVSLGTFPNTVFERVDTGQQNYVYLVSNDTAYRYIRVTIDNVQDSGGLLRITEIKLSELVAKGYAGNFVLEDDSGDEVTIEHNNEVKFIGSGITTNWTDTDNGTDGDPYDLTFTVDAAQTGITSLLATDIKIGEDDQTKIDFEDVNEIHFYANNVEQVYLADNIFGPQSDSDVDLGTTGVRWKDAFVDSLTTTGDIDCGGEVQTANIGYTDGDNAMTIADGGKVTFAAGFAVGSDVEGDILYSNGTNYVRLARGTDDHVLTMNGNVPNWEAASGGGGSSEWTDTGSVLHPTDSSGTADAVVIGGTTTGNSDIAFNTDGSAVFNEQSASVDFRVESNGNANMLFVDGSADSVGIGTSLPEAELSVAGEISARDGFSSSVKAHTDLTSNGVVTYNITGPALQTIVLKANQTNTYLGSETLPVGKTVTIRLSACGANRTLAWHGSMNFVGEKPASIASGKQALLSITTFGTVCATAGKSDVTCAYAVED